MCLDQVNSKETFFERCVSQGEIPTQMAQARMVCLPKQSKINNHQIDVAHCRPIIIIENNNSCDKHDNELHVQGGGMGFE